MPVFKSSTVFDVARGLRAFIKTRGEHRGLRKERHAATEDKASTLPLPTFLIIGAQKSGTRWLRDNLHAHPEILAAEGEPSFFNNRNNFEKGLDWYRICFEGWNGEPHVGESTPGYMMWREDPDVVAARIDDLLPGVKLIAILRNPVDRTYSAFLHHMRKGRIPPDTDILEQIWSVAPEQDRLRLIAGGWYTASLAPYVERFGDRLAVFLQDEIVSAPDRLYTRALGHIGATTNFLPEQLQKVRHKGRVPGESSYAGDGGSSQALTKPRDLTPEERAELYEYFRDDIGQLEELLGWDLNLWRPPEERVVSGTTKKIDKYERETMKQSPLEVKRGGETSRDKAVPRLVDESMSRTAILRSILSPLRPGKFLDLGTGHGKFALVARDLGWEVTAVDARDTRMPVEEKGVEWVVSDVREFPFKSEDYDCVGILGLLYHLDFQSQMELLRRSSGTLTILDTFVSAFAEDEEGGYPGAYYVETGETEEKRNAIPQASWGNASSFWPTEESLIRMFREAGFSLTAPIQPGHRRDRTFYVCYPPESRSVEAQQPHPEGLKSQSVEGRQNAQQLVNENRRLRERVQKLEDQLQQIYDSNSWKIARTLSSARVRVSEKAAALLGRVRSRG